MATERIESLISKEALAQFDELNAKLGISITGFEKLVAKAVETNKALGGAKTFKQVIDGTKELEKAEADLAKQKTELQKQQEKLNALYTEEAKRIAELKTQQQSRNQQIKEEVQLNQAAEGSIKQKQIQIKQLQRDYDNLSAAERNASQGKGLLKSIQELDKELKTLEGSTGRFHRNVGNYSGALKTLESALNDVNKNIDNYNKSGQQNSSVLQSLTKEQSLLQSLIDTQSQGFANATAEIRKNQQAIQLLSQVYGEDSTVVQNLISQTGKLTDEVGDLRAKIKLQASDTKVFDGLINSAQGLVAVYSIAQGAAALFGDENEELQKTMVKLQAVMAVLQGLQSIQNVLQKESAARQLITIGLQKISNIQTGLQTAAESKNIVVRYAAIVAQKALNLAMSAAGGPILAVIGLIALMLLSMKSFASQAEASAKSLGQLTAEFERDSKAVNEYIDDVKRLGDEQLADLQRNFASEKEVREQRSKNLREQFRTVFDLERQYASDIERQRVKLVKILKKSQKDMTEDEKKQIEDQDKLIQDYRSLQKQRADIASQIRVGSADNERATREESIKSQQDELEALKSNLQARANIQNDVVGNDKKSYDARLSALDQFQKLQQRILQSDTQKQLLVPTLTPSQRRLIVTQAKAAQDEINRNTKKQREALLEEQKSRERKAQYDISRIAIETQAAADQEIIANENKSLEDRLFAAYDFMKAQEALIIGQKNVELSNATLTANERKAIEAKANADILASKVAFNKQVEDITLQNLDVEGQRRIAQSNKTRDEELTALNERYNSGKISLQQYEREKLDIERKYTEESLRIQIANIDKVIEEYKTQGKDVTELEAARAAAEKALSDNVTDHKKKNIKELRDLEKQLAQETLDAIISITNDGFERDLQRIEEQRDALEQRSEREIALTNAEALSKEEKEKKIATIEARTQAQRENLERRQRAIELQRAKFEKAVNIGKIIAETALAVAHQLSSGDVYTAIPRAIVVGAIGAVQLAKAISAPLPKFATGTDDAPGGLAWVGDAYRKELVVTPEGKLIETPAVPTVMNVPKHSIVMPDAEQAIRAMNAHLAQSTTPMTVDNGRYYREMTATLGGKLDKLEKTIKNKREVHIRRTRDGWEKITKSGGNETNYLNRNLQG
jgi:DNA repair exonuclease SbcCD ATPase subunit